jgi:hypothetical protein
MNLKDVKRYMKGLSPGRLRKFEGWLRDLIERAEQDSGVTKQPAVQERRAGGLTYRLERVRCGKEKCKCVEGELHGPYWYSYRTEGGRTRSQYVGKKLPANKKR